MVDQKQRYTHYYNRGWWHNLREIIYPRCYEPDENYYNMVSNKAGKNTSTDDRIREKREMSTKTD